MVIKIKYYGIDTTNLPLTVELPEHSTIENLLDHVSEITNDSRSSLLKSSMFLVNNAKADHTTSLHDKDVVHVLNVLGGG